ncbi:hypothetical protein EDB89DRAFT_1911941 [Lactarius sanguifluus]|nr:hypothetical protein EDB89DRAFT_1911941 [Lactarius sanguifluus]
MTFTLTKRGLDVLKMRLDSAAGKSAACARAKTVLERHKLSPWPSPFIPSPSYKETWHRMPPLEAREEYGWMPPAEARERYEEWIYDAYGAPMEYEVWGLPKEETGYDWDGNRVVWDHYQDEWTLPPAEVREEYEDLEYPPAAAREEYEEIDEYHDYYDEDEEGYYDAQIAVYDEYAYDADDEEFKGPSWAMPRDDAREEYDAEAALERPDPPAEAREEYEDYAEEEEYEEEYDEEKFPAGDVQDDGYDEDWMGPRATPEKRVRFPAEEVHDDGYDEGWMGPHSGEAEYPSAHRHGEASIEDWIPAPLEPLDEARERYAAPEASTHWQQQVSQARGELMVAQQHAWYPSTAPVTYEPSIAMDTSAGRTRLRAAAAKFPRASRLGALTTAKQEDEGQRGRCPRKEGNVAFTPEMPEEFLQEDDVHAFGAMTQEHWEAWRHIEASFPSS